jgi:hypothetical protein
MKKFHVAHRDLNYASYEIGPMTEDLAELRVVVADHLDLTATNIRVTVTQSGTIENAR